MVRAESRQESSFLDQDLNDDGSFNTFIRLGQQDVPSLYKSPFSFGAGASRAFGATTLHVRSSGLTVWESGRCLRPNRWNLSMTLSSVLP